MARIYQTYDMGEAHVVAALVGHPGEADLCVYRVDSWGYAHGDAYWYITRNKQDATAYVYFGSRGMARVRICFVDSHTQAGWQGPHPLKGRFG